VTGRAAPSQANGFTLVELLVSLAILAMFGAMLLASIDKTALFLVRSRTRFVDQDSIGSAQALVRGRIQQLRALARDNGATPLIDVNGDATSFSFFAPPVDRDAPDALWRYRLTATAAGQLILYTANSLDNRFDFAARETAGWQPITLLEGVKALNITYFGSDERGLTRSWQTRWIVRAQPPELVRIRVQFEDGDQRVWPDLIVRPRATVNTACKIDPLTGTCRQVSS
jgi:general secretion pathway protein J